MKVCYMVGAGDFGSFKPELQEGDLVIACDGGYEACREKGLRIDLVIGDFDSLGYIPEGVEHIQLPVEKDVTDMEAGIDEGIRRGYRRFELLGGTGGRLSHTLANIQMMAGLSSKGIECILHGKGSRIYIMENCRRKFDAGKKGSISVFAICGPAEGVTINGMKYEICNRRLSPTFPLGVSNSFMGRESFVEVKEGKLLIIEEE